MAQINKPGLHFNTKLYTGNNSTNAITGVGFQPDFVWLKPRNANDNHRLMNAVSTADQYLVSNATSAETGTGSNFASFDSDGFTLGGSDGGWNSSSYNYVSWNWKAGGGQGSSNTDGSINTTYTSVNTTAGFSISTYTGTGSAGTIGHGLGSTPKMIIVKCRSNSDTWAVYHVDVGATKYMELDTTAAAQTSTQPWNDTAPTSSLFTVGNWSATNGSSKTYIAYCFAEKKGYSRFGKYIGNGNNNGTFVYTGFKPNWLMIKKTSATGSWYMYDFKRPGYNTSQSDSDSLIADGTDQEFNSNIDLLSNGFKVRTSGTGENQTNASIIYMAFAENPIVGTNKIPTVAR